VKVSTRVSRMFVAREKADDTAPIHVYIWLRRGTFMYCTQGSDQVVFLFAFYAYFSFKLKKFPAVDDFMQSTRGT